MTTTQPQTTEAADDLRPYFETLTKAELIDVALHLEAETHRLRRELDEAMGVIR